MAALENLRSQGWHISSEGFDKLSQNASSSDIRTITRKALDVDIRDIGAPIIASEITKIIFGPVILQIVKIRNVSAPKSKPNSQGAPRMLKLILTDGHTNCQGVEIKQLSSLSADKTIPGTKLFINGAQIVSGCILLVPEHCKVLGGSVSALIEKWELSKLMPSHARVNQDGPPAWVNFGKKIVANINSQGFKSLENKNKENAKEDVEFQVQRQDAIAEATHGAVKKVFGGGVKPAQTFNSETNSNFNNNQNYTPRERAPRQPKGRGRDKSELEKIEKPSQRVSLFDFLEDKLPVTETIQPKSQAPRVFDVPPPSRPRNDYNESSFQRNRIPQENSLPKQSYREPTRYKPPQHENNYSTGTSHSTYNNRPEPEYKSKPYQAENKYPSDRPPRFQKQRNDAPANKYPSNSTEPKSKPNTNNFVDKLTHEINNISLYNSKYETEKLNKQPPVKVPDNQSKPWKWKVGDKCMAKYWEDNKFYNAVVTGITTKTCMVEFLEYGNFEEVLHCDCIPILTDKQERQHINKTYNDNQQFSGSLEFRRGKNRPYVRPQNKAQGQNKNYES